ncbi:MAG TPA: exonuclease sbcCD subunit D [Desulfobacteraceae bacterium]|nr:exonuclease sbcCD subunit D [Desulfobacteraceae bacterium]
MKILHTSDWHLGKRLGRFSRIDEQKEVLNEIIEIADNYQADAVIVSGDLFDAHNPAADAVELLYKSLKKFANNGRRAVIAIAGNHDSPDRIDAPEPLARECGIIFAGYPNSVIAPFELDSGLKVIQSDKGFLELKLPDSEIPLRLLITPYPNEYRLKAYFNCDNDEKELRKVLAEAWEQLAEKYCDNAGINMLSAHLYMVKKGGEMPEEPEDEKPILGGAQEIFTECLPKQIQYVALGHLHRKQIMDTLPCPAVYSGSILSYSFSEAEQDKFVMLIESAENQAISFNPIKLTKGRKLFRKRFDNTDQAISWLKENPNCFIELTMVSDTYLSAEIKKRLHNAHDGIVSIIPQIISASSISPYQDNAIDLTKNIHALFADYFTHKHGQSPNEDIKNLFKEVLAEEEYFQTIL